MDLIYKARPPQVTEKLNIKEVMLELSQQAKEFQKLMLELKLKNVGNGTSLSLDEFCDSFNSTPPLTESYMQVCDVEALKAKPHNFVKPCFSEDVLNLKFKTVEHARRRRNLENMHQVRRLQRNSYGTIELPKNVRPKYRGMRYLEDGRDKEKMPGDRPDLVPNEDFVCVVRTYHPFKHVIGSEATEKPRLCQNIVAHGRNTLEQLRSMIICSKDMGAGREMSENPQARASLTYDKYKSGFLFIDNTFYNATRDPTSIDYSAGIRKWAAERKIGPLKTATLEHTCLQDLTVQLGYPYVYQHQGDCEHLIVFGDLRLVANNDPVVVRNYPYVIELPSYQSRNCDVCRQYKARWLTEGSTRLPVDPCYFCETCFYSFNYIDGKKVSEFKAFPYFHHSMLI